MTDYNKLIEQLNHEYKACADSVSIIGHRFALLQLLFDTVSVIKELSELKNTLENEVVEETHGYLSVWLSKDKWPSVSYNVMDFEFAEDANIYQRIEEFVQIGINNALGRDLSVLYSMQNGTTDPIINYLVSFSDSVNLLASDRLWHEDYINCAIYHAINRLFQTINEVIKADKASKTPTQYSNYYNKLKTQAFAESTAKLDIKNWKEQEGNNRDIDELNFKIYKTIEKLNETECLKDNDDIVTDRKRQSCKKELEELCGVAEVPDSVATCYCLIKTLANVNENMIVIDAAKAGRYIYENRNWLTNEQRTAFKSFDWKMQELCKIAEKIKLTAAEEAVRRATKEAIKKNEGAKTFKKEVLKPYRVAIDECIIERIWDIVQFNNTFGVNIDKASWSRWINGRDSDNYKYKPNETAELIELYSVYPKINCNQ